MITVREVTTAQDLDRFVKLPFAIYQGDPNWVSPLLSDLKRTLTPGKNPFWTHAERKLFLAEKDSRPVGRVCATVDANYNGFHKSSIGFFGFFESTDDQETANALIAAACRWCREKGMTMVYGPANPSLNDEAGLLLDGFDSPPLVKMSYNPRYYEKLIQAAGLCKVKDLHAYVVAADRPMPEKYTRVIEMLKAKPGVKVRPIDLKHLKEDLESIKEIYNDAWSDNWDFAPMTSEEIDDMAKQLKPLIVPELCPMVFCKGEPAAMSIALPDYNQVLARLGGRLLPFGWLKFLIYKGKITRGRLWALGVKAKFRHQGFDSLLYYESLVAARKLGYKQGEVSWILEDNLSIIRPILNLGGRLYKTYRVYQQPL